MREITESIKHFLEKQHFVVVSSLEKNSLIHTSAKAVLEADTGGKIFILDIYKGRTYRNIKANPQVTLTAIDEHRYKGYSIMGQARIVKENAVPEKIHEIWRDRISKRIARRLIRHVKDDVPGHEGMPEARFPLPKYIIEIDVREVVDLAPENKGVAK